MIDDIVCVILTGGRSSRMRADAGIDKAHLDFWGEPLYLRQFKKFQNIFTQTYISAKTFDAYPRISTFNIVKDLPKVDIQDTTMLFAPALGMFSAFETLFSKRIFFIGVDTPFVKVATIAKLANTAKSSKQNAIVARCNGKIHPMCGIYQKSVSDELKNMIMEDKHKLTLFLEKIGTIFVDFEDEEEFLNINRYEDYKKVINDGADPFR
jgi:molybdenum cofactor guanylyltransferase